MTTVAIPDSLPSSLLTVREVAAQLRVDDTTVRRWIKGGALSAVALPHRGTRQAYRVHQHALNAILGSTPIAPDPDDDGNEDE